jgi:hypothetical protein
MTALVLLSLALAALVVGKHLDDHRAHALMRVERDPHAR